VSRWIDPSRILASCARDVLDRLERGMDDRTIEERRAHAARAHACAVAELSRLPFGVKAKVGRPKAGVPVNLQAGSS
jgi:hypothetical protein